LDGNVFPAVEERVSRFLSDSSADPTMAQSARVLNFIISLFGSRYLWAKVTPRGGMREMQL
jgi:hypothetical protein